MIGFLGIFGRSHELKRLDQAVRAVGLHPRLVPDAVQLTILKLLKEAEGGANPAPRAYDAAAETARVLHAGPARFHRGQRPTPDGGDGGALGSGARGG